MTRSRCPRGHFTTAPTDTCHCTPSPRRRRARSFDEYDEYDLRGQGATADQLRTATTIQPTGSYL